MKQKDNLNLLQAYSDGKPAIKLNLTYLGVMHSKNLMTMVNQIHDIGRGWRSSMKIKFHVNKFCVFVSSPVS